MKRTTGCLVLLLLALLVTTLLIVIHTKMSEIEQRDVTPIEMLTSEDALTFEGAIEFALAIDAYKDEVRDEMPRIERDNVVLYELALTIVPYFYYEGITHPLPNDIPTSELYPAKIMWYKFPLQRHFHVSGSANCFYSPGVIAMNMRYADPYDSWYSADSSLFAVLTHELAHINGICDRREYMETATQLATLEVLAGMSNHGNIYAYPAFLDELQDYAIEYAWSLALKEDRMDEFYAYAGQMASTRFGVASLKKAMRYWSGDMLTLERILSKYGEAPYRFLVAALNDKLLHTRMFGSVPNKYKVIKMNDTDYIIRHIEELTDDYGELVKDKR